MAEPISALISFGALAFGFRGGSRSDPFAIAAIPLPPEAGRIGARGDFPAGVRPPRIAFPIIPAFTLPGPTPTPPSPDPTPTPSPDPTPTPPSPTPSPDPTPTPPSPTPSPDPTPPRVSFSLPTFGLSFLQPASVRRPRAEPLGFLPPVAVPPVMEGVRQVLIQIGRVLLGVMVGSGILMPGIPRRKEDEETQIEEFPLPLPIPRRIIRIPQRKPIPEIELEPIPQPERRAQPRRETRPAPGEIGPPVEIPVQIPTEIPSPSIPRRQTAPPSRVLTPAQIGTIVFTASGLANLVSRSLRGRPGVGRIEPTIPREVPSPGLPDPTPTQPGAPSPTPTPPGTDLPPVVSPVQQSFAQQLTQQVRSRKREKDCVEVKRKRKRGRCFEGFYEERFGKTRFTKWREVDCVAGFTIPKRVRGLI